MRNLLFALFATALLVACGSTQKASGPSTEPTDTFTQTEAATPTPTATKAPWVGEDPAYIDQLQCEEATKVAKQLMSWPLADAEALDDGSGEKFDNPVDVGGGRFVAMLANPDNAAVMALTQYREQNSTRVYEGFIVMNQETGEAFMLVDFYVVKALIEGDVSEETAPEEAFSMATGEYFCLAP